MVWTLAVRNVMRNRRRSVITVLSIAVGLAALTFLWGFIDGMNRQMINNTTRYFAADAQVHLKGYHDDPSLDRAIEAGRGGSYWLGVRRGRRLERDRMKNDAA